MNERCLRLLVVALAVLAGQVRAQEAGPFWLDPRGVPGALVISGGGSLPDAILDRFCELAGGPQARIVVIPTASATAEATLADPQRREALLAAWRARQPAALDLLHTRSREQASDDTFVAPLRQATAVWFGGGDQSRIAAAYLGTAVEREIAALLARGGVVGGTSAGAAIQSRVMIAGGRTEPTLATGLDLLPGAIIDQHFLARQRRERLLAAVQRHPECVGIGIDEGTALVVQGRRMEVLGRSSVTIVLAESKLRPRRELVLEPGARHDLTMLRRAALERARDDFPPAQPPPPRVARGALVIVGGGTLPEAVTSKFIELAGGPDAPIVVLPIAAADTLDGDAAADTRLWERAGARRVRSLRARTRDEVESPEFAAALAEARGIWFGGGRQWRFVDAYLGTKAEALLAGVLERGGVIGGSSAGASIQAQYMVRGSPLGNTDMMAEGYERGLGFLPGAAVDQHFTQRRREPDLLAVVRRHPQWLGIGIDEGTALVVRGSAGEVIGRGNVHFYDARQSPDAPARTVAEPGATFDLVERRLTP